MSGEVVHFELPAKDLARARKFYQKTFGWKMESVPEMDYTLVQTARVDRKGMPRDPGTINGGMAERGGPLKTTVVTVLVTNIDATVRKVARAGGRLVRKKMSIGPMGFVAYISDTEGNVVGLFQPGKM